jgi:hypothetical protein
MVLVLKEMRKRHHQSSTQENRPMPQETHWKTQVNRWTQTETRSKKLQKALLKAHHLWQETRLAPKGKH